MPQKARIRISSTDRQMLDDVCGQISSITKRTGVRLSGPVPLPTKKLKVPLRKTPCGEGTATWEKWELRIHKRLIDIDTL